MRLNVTLELQKKGINLQDILVELAISSAKPVEHITDDEIANLLAEARCHRGKYDNKESN